MTRTKEFILTAHATEYPVSLWDLHATEPPPIETIAHSLSQINRFAGHTWRPYSVAEHSLLCVDIANVRFDASAVVQLACLMHDAHECITGDVSSPVKRVLGEVWLDFERAVAQRLRRDWKLLSTFVAHRETIRACDLVALATERRDLLAFEHGRNLPWPVIDSPGACVEPFENIDLHDYAAMPPEYWRDRFVEEYDALRAAVAQQSADLLADQIDQMLPGAAGIEP